MCIHPNNGRLIMKKVINAQAQTVTFTFEGELAPIVLAMSQVSPANAAYAMLHGFAARVGDNAAIKKSAENNYTVTEAMRREAVAELVAEHARIGNVYVNRNQIGAVPGVQPFGGEGLSGTGPKAGGPWMLPALAVERTISIDTTAAGGNAALMSDGADKKNGTDRT